MCTRRVYVPSTWQYPHPISTSCHGRPGGWVNGLEWNGGMKINGGMEQQRNGIVNDRAHKAAST